MNPLRLCTNLFMLLLNLRLSLRSTVTDAFLSKAPLTKAKAAIPLVRRFYADDTKRKGKSNKGPKIQVPTWVPDEIDESGYSRPVIQWYPGHIAKAERLLKETFQAVDVVVEVRDARAPKATSHPKVEEWCSGRPRLVVFTHVDIVPSATHRAWKAFLEKEGETEETSNSLDAKIPEHFLWVDAKKGQGIPALHRAIFKAGAHVQERRQRRGLKDRPLRVGLMGYPNVGKSALINRLLGRRRARTANTPGVTRSLQWIRVRTDDTKKTSKKEYELLDSPGIIPASLEDQSDALLLAACHCIGEASYDNQIVASYLCQWMQSLSISGQAEIAAPDWRRNCKNRWGVDPLLPVEVENLLADKDEEPELRYITGEEMLYKVADNTCKGSPEDASRKILQDFRAGRMGNVCLQLAPNLERQNHDGSFQDFSNVPDPRMGTVRTVAQDGSNDWERLREQHEAEKLERVKMAMETAKERGLELPPHLENPTTSDKPKETSEDVGKGLFDGW